MDRVMKYGWIVGLICLPLGGYRIYLYLSGTDTLGLWSLAAGLFILAAGVFNLAMYYKYRT